jgi:hypothetical protein
MLNFDGHDVSVCLTDGVDLFAVPGTQLLTLEKDEEGRLDLGHSVKDDGEMGKLVNEGDSRLKKRKSVVQASLQGLFQRGKSLIRVMVL